MMSEFKVQIEIMVNNSTTFKSTSNSMSSSPWNLASHSNYFKLTVARCCCFLWKLILDWDNIIHRICFLFNSQARVESFSFSSQQRYDKLSGESIETIRYFKSLIDNSMLLNLWISIVIWFWLLLMVIKKMAPNVMTLSSTSKLMIFIDFLFHFWFH